MCVCGIDKNHTVIPTAKLCENKLPHLTAYNVARIL